MTLWFHSPKWHHIFTRYTASNLQFCPHHLRDVCFCNLSQVRQMSSKASLYLRYGPDLESAQNSQFKGSVSFVISITLHSSSLPSALVFLFLQRVSSSFCISDISLFNYESCTTFTSSTVQVTSLHLAWIVQTSPCQVLSNPQAPLSIITYVFKGRKSYSRFQPDTGLSYHCVTFLKIILVHQELAVLFSSQAVSPWVL